MKISVLKYLMLIMIVLTLVDAKPGIFSKIGNVLKKVAKPLMLIPPLGMTVGVVGALMAGKEKK